MRVPFTVVYPDGTRVDLQAEMDGPVRLSDLLDSAQIPLSYPGAPVWIDGRLAQVDDPAVHVGLRPGALLSLTSPPATAPEIPDPSAYLHLAVVGGPCGGQVAALAAGPTTVGRAPGCDVRLADPTVSGRHFRLTTSPNGAVTVEDLGSSNGLLLDGVPLSGAAAFEAGQVLVAGDTSIELRNGSPADAVLHALEGFEEVRRPPRLRTPPPKVDIAWPAEPVARKGPVIPLASALIPLLMGGVLYAVTGSALMLLFILMTPMLAAANFLTAKRSGRKENKEASAGHTAAMERARSELAEAQAAEKAGRATAHPDPAVVMATVAGPRRRLWERRRGDPDFLHVRVGVATLPSDVRLSSTDPYATDTTTAPAIAGVPCVVSLKEFGVLGVAGRRDVVRANAAWMVAQQVVLTGPADLGLVVLSESRSGDHDDWDWAKWLPHVETSGPAGPGSSGPGSAAGGAWRPPSTLEDRVRAVVEVVESRWRVKEQSRVVPGGPDEHWSWLIVVLDPAHDVRRIPGIDVVLQRGPAVQVVAICVEENESYLPPECRAVVLVDSEGDAVVKLAGEAPVDGVAADRVQPEWCEAIGRRLAPMRDPETRSGSAQIPASARLVSILGTDAVTAEGVQRGWRTGGRTTRAVVGVGLEGPFALDLRVDGPHGLVAGTTGAGKSEFLQTLVASLAVANRPDALTFLLVDYKGGSAFRDCALLPHTVGIVTDLDGHLTERALVSLGAELKRREELLAQAAAKDIDDYVTAGEPLGPLPRLVIVIDEFAGLVAELPDFVTGLVGIAQRGRSLGIHLILATQRPSGVVSPEIRANTNLRVALRVTSPAESVDIIDAPDAARISPATPGRALAVTGHSTLTSFQAGRVGEPAAAAGDGQPARLGVAPLTWATAGRKLATVSVDGAGEPVTVDPSDTDLSRLVAALLEAAAGEGVDRQRQPWLAPLPSTVPLADIGPTPATPTPGRVRAVPVGLVDLPAVQRQDPWLYEVASPRHLLIAGSPGSGRTTALRTLAAALTVDNHPDDLWLYVVDCGGGELRRLADLPHCGAVVTRNETDRVDRLLGRLRGEMTRRLDLLARTGHTDLAEHRAAAAHTGERILPYIVVLVDRWEGFMSAFDQVDSGRLTETILDLAREGGAAGIRLVVAGDRQVLFGKLSAMVEHRVCLNLAEMSDYSMAGLDPRRVPPTMVPGRAVRTGDQAELQIAVPGSSAAGAAQAAALTELAARWRTADASVSAPPFRIDALPDRIDLGDVAALPSNRTAGQHWALIGVGGDELSAIGVDLSGPGGFVVAGPRRSGRSTALVVMARSLLRSGASVLAFCPRTSPLQELRGTPGVVGVVGGQNPSVAETLEIVNAVEGPMAVLVDDAGLLHGGDLSELLESIGRDGPEQGHVMVIAGGAEELGRPMRGFIFEVRQSRAGLLLCPESHLHGEVIGARLARSSVFSRPVGRGVLVSDDRLMTVQVPKP